LFITFETKTPYTFFSTSIQRKSDISDLNALHNDNSLRFMYSYNRSIGYCTVRASGGASFTRVTEKVKKLWNTLLALGP